MTSSLLSKINQRFDKMSKGQKKIAKYVMEHYDTAAFMTAAKLGETVRISESTVVRFATELGCKGYPEFQKELRDMVRSKLTGIQRIDVFDAMTNGEDVIEKTLKSDTQLINNTLQSVSPETFEKSVDAIVSAKKIYIIGMRSASFLAGFLSYYLKRIFDNVELVNVSSDIEIYENVFRAEEGDVCIAISMPRYSKLTIRAVNFLRERKVKIIGITDNEDAPLGLVSDYVLVAKSGITSIVDSLVAPLSLLNALIGAITLKMADSLRENYILLENIWDNYEVYEKLEEDTDD